VPETLRTAAVIGPLFDLQVLAHVMDMTEDAVLATRIRAGVRPWPKWSTPLTGGSSRTNWFGERCSIS
jgi:hypothetical protein